MHHLRVARRLRSSAAGAWQQRWRLLQTQRTHRAGRHQQTTAGSGHQRGWKAQHGRPQCCACAVRQCGLRRRRQPRAAGQQQPPLSRQLPHLHLRPSVSQDEETGPKAGRRGAARCPTLRPPPIQLPQKLLAASWIADRPPLSPQRWCSPRHELTQLASCDQNQHLTLGAPLALMLASVASALPTQSAPNQRLALRRGGVQPPQVAGQRQVQALPRASPQQLRHAGQQLRDPQPCGAAASVACCTDSRTFQVRQRPSMQLQLRLPRASVAGMPGSQATGPHLGVGRPLCTASAWTGDRCKLQDDVSTQPLQTGAWAAACHRIQAARSGASGRHCQGRACHSRMLAAAAGR